jgi:hypothetical protein
MAANMRWARRFELETGVGLEDARTGETYLCEHCPSELRYNADYEQSEGVCRLLSSFISEDSTHSCESASSSPVRR